MSLKSTLRGRICLFQMTPNYPVNEFVQWALGLGVTRTRLLEELDELQWQLDIEAEALRRYSDVRSDQVVQQEYWCFYCEQIRAHFRDLLPQVLRTPWQRALS